ncbi:MAG: hypothetical protein IJE93_03005 [Clostridia bacterium]|nr:hypothetical protein [Clostridia bacterium]
MNTGNNEKRIPNKKKKSSGNNVSLIKVAGLTVLLLLLILAAAFFLNNKMPSATVSNEDNTDIFYSINSDNLKDMLPFSDGVALLGASSLRYLDASGNEIVTNTHSFSNPAIEINGKTAILYDRGGYSLRIENNTSEYRNLTFNSVITTATIGNKGNYAYVLNSDSGYQSHLYVYTLNGKKQFEWGSASDYIIDAALSDNGKYAAVTLMGIEGAQYFSKVILFKFNSSEPVYTVELRDTTVYEIDFVGSKKLSVYSDTGVYVINNKGEFTAVQAYSASEMSYSSVYYNGLACTLISRYSNEKEPVLTVFNKRGKQIYTHSFSEQITGVYCAKSYVCVIADNVLEILNTEGTVIGRILLNEACVDAVIAGRRVFALTSSGVHSIAVNTNNTLSDSIIETQPEAENTTEKQTEADTTAEKQTEADTTAEKQTEAESTTQASLGAVG